MLMTPTLVSDEVNHRTVYGDYNSPPPGLVEIDEKEFSSSMFFVYTPTKVEFRQIVPNRLPWKGEKYYLSIRLFFFHDGNGLGMSNVHGVRVRYFRFTLCDHKDSEVVKLGNCHHKYTCRKCGYVNEVDSSD